MYTMQTTTLFDEEIEAATGGRPFKLRPDPYRSREFLASADRAFRAMNEVRRSRPVAGDILVYESADCTLKSWPSANFISYHGSTFEYKLGGYLRARRRHDIVRDDEFNSFMELLFMQEAEDRKDQCRRSRAKKCQQTRT